MQWKNEICTRFSNSWCVHNLLCLEISSHLYSQYMYIPGTFGIMFFYSCSCCTLYMTCTYMHSRQFRSCLLMSLFVFWYWYKITINCYNISGYHWEPPFSRSLWAWSAWRKAKMGFPCAMASPPSAAFRPKLAKIELTLSLRSAEVRVRKVERNCGVRMVARSSTSVCWPSGKRGRSAAIISGELRSGATSSFVTTSLSGAISGCAICCICCCCWACWPRGELAKAAIRAAMLSFVAAGAGGGASWSPLHGSPPWECPCPPPCPCPCPCCCADSERWMPTCRRLPKITYHTWRKKKKGFKNIELGFLLLFKLVSCVYAACISSSSTTSPIRMQVFSA